MVSFCLFWGVLQSRGSSHPYSTLGLTTSFQQFSMCGKDALTDTAPTFWGVVGQQPAATSQSVWFLCQQADVSHEMCSVLCISTGSADIFSNHMWNEMRFYWNRKELPVGNEFNLVNHLLLSKDMSLHTLTPWVLKLLWDSNVNVFLCLFKCFIWLYSHMLIKSLTYLWESV